MKKVLLIVGISLVFAVIACRQENAQTGNPQVFPLVGWSSWGGLNVTDDIANQRITFNGDIRGKAAGYVIQSSLPYGGMVLTLEITNSGNSSYDHYKMFKLEVNGQPLKPLEQQRINLNDQDYINAGDKSVSFRLPNTIGKVQLVFWNARIEQLSVTGTVSKK